MKNNYGKIFILSALLTVLLFAGLNCALAESINTKADLDKIESDMWGLKYQNEEDTARLSRIEQSVFGSVNSSSSIEERLNKINKALGFETQKEINAPLSELYTAEAEGVNYPVVDNIEMQLFGKNYKKENIYKRLDRLEKKVFGSVQAGNLAQRTDGLKARVAMSAPSSTLASYPDNYGYNLDPYGQNTNAPLNDWGMSKTPANQERVVYEKALERARGQNYNGYNNFAYGGSDASLQIAGLESTVFGQTYSQDPMGLRLNRLERKIFQRDFASDDEYTRLERLQAASVAKKTAKYYDNNKFQKFASSGIQLGTLVLMILALIL